MHIIILELPDKSIALIVPANDARVKRVDALIDSGGEIIQPAIAAETDDEFFNRVVAHALVQDSTLPVPLLTGAIERGRVLPADLPDRAFKARKNWRWNGATSRVV